MRTKYLFKLILILSGYVILVYVAWTLRVKLLHRSHVRDDNNKRIVAMPINKNGFYGNSELKQTTDWKLIKTGKARHDPMVKNLGHKNVSKTHTDKKVPSENGINTAKILGSFKSPHIKNSNGNGTKNISAKSELAHKKVILSSATLKPAPPSSSNKTANLSLKGKSNPKVICVQIFSGTGNRIFQFMAAYVIARKKNMTVVVPGHLKRFSEGFMFPSDVSHNISKCENISDVSHWPLGIYSETFITEIVNTKDVFIHGYFQSYKYFQHDINLVKSVLKFHPHVLSKAKSTLNLLLSQRYGKTSDFQHSTGSSRNITLIGLHVRRGDKIEDERQVQAGYKVAPLEYILKAVAVMKRKHPKSVFVTVSDDIQWCLTNLHTLEDTVFLKATDWPQSMAILSLMDHTIITVGTFGWWGAWLAGGDVIYYKDFLTPGSKMDSLVKLSDYFPSSWQGLSDKDIHSANLT